jgi:hypothetical protein
VLDQVQRRPAVRCVSQPGRRAGTGAVVDDDHAQLEAVVMQLKRSDASAHVLERVVDRDHHVDLHAATSDGQALHGLDRHQAVCGRYRARHVPVARDDQ